MTYRRQADVPCINCQDKAMSQVATRGVSYWECNSCRSAWIDEDSFRSLMRLFNPSQDSELLIHNMDSNRRNCPVCKEPMDLAWILFLRLDQCEEDGIWFDPGELEQALAGDVGKELLKDIEERSKKEKK